MMGGLSLGVAWSSDLVCIEFAPRGRYRLGGLEGEGFRETRLCLEGGIEVRSTWKESGRLYATSGSV